MVEAGVVEAEVERVFPVDPRPDGVGRLAVAQPLAELHERDRGEAPGHVGRLPAPGVEVGEAGVVEHDPEPVAQEQVWVASPKRRPGDAGGGLGHGRDSGLGAERHRLQRLRQFDDPANVEALLNLPQRLFARAEAMRRGQRAAVLVQTAIAIGILIVAPMRMRNLTMIDLDRHLVRPGRSREVMMIAFERSEVKNRQYLEYPMPEDAVAWLERYLTEYRPLLAPEGSTALFPARDGGPKGRAVLGPRISRVIFGHTGLEMHPQLFRHFAAKLQLDEEPGSYELVRRLLGHTSLATTTRF